MRPERLFAFRGIAADLPDYDERREGNNLDEKLKELKTDSSFGLVLRSAPQLISFAKEC
jgi:hypothetical protein